MARSATVGNGPCACLTMLVVLAAAPAAGAAEPSSHRPIDLGREGLDQFLKEVMKADVSRLVEKAGTELTPEQQQLMRKVLANPRDPRAQELIRLARESGGKTELSREDLLRLAEALEKLRPGAAPVDPPTVDPRDPTPAPAPPVQSGVKVKTEDLKETTRLFLELSKKFEGWSIPGLDGLVKDWGKEAGSSGANLDLARLNRILQVGNDWFKEGVPELPALPEFAGDGGLPAAGPGVPEVSADGLVGLLVAGIVILLLVVLGKSVGGRVRVQLDEEFRRRSLGPWPVFPEAIASRSELIQAFEYLTLLRLGDAARSWNHLEVAECLGGEEATRREAARELAGAYALARYAPEDDALSHEALAAARRDLCLLAGAPTA